MNDAIGEGTITRLLTEQAPRLADLPLTFVRDGWDNTIWRLGDRLAVRVTRRVVAVDLHLHEQRWLPGLSAMLPLPVPAPVIAGAPSVHHPWPWSVVPWFDGDVAATAAPAPSEAAVLGAFLSALHTAAPAAAAANPARGGPMASHRAALMTWAEQAAATESDDLIAAAVRVFDAGVVAAPATDRVWIHGDLHARNVLVSERRLAAVLDWGDVGAGDAAVDLAAVWWLFDAADHGCFWSAYGQFSPDLWSRARAWAALFGLSFMTFGMPNAPGEPDTDARALGRRLIRRVVAHQSAARIHDLLG